ncbi:hypothetical protein [Lewinella sp. LCG006]|uniref:hypothetical protein n=1 Tax=Lewinella sp. LCG006 TaxID=3231911 RepID=UPI0034604BA5
MIKEAFIQAIHDKRKVKITFDSKSKGRISRVCIPFDYGPSRRNLKDNPDRYHTYDLESPDGKHTLSIHPEQVVNLEVLTEHFDPADYITWSPNWFVKRDWGKFS